VLSLASSLITASGVPPEVVFLGSTCLGEGGSVLVVPRSVTLEVTHNSLPVPVLTNEFTLDLGTVGGHGGVTVEVVTEHALGGSLFTHVNGETVKATVTKTVAGQKVVFGSHGAILHAALHTNVDTRGENVTRPDIILAIVTWAILVVTGLEGAVRVGEGTIVS